MPYHIESSTGEYKIVDDTGKVHGTHPTRKQAVAQLQALYANVPDAKKELFDASEMSAKGRESAISALKAKGIDNPSDDQINEQVVEMLKASKDPDDYLIVEDRDMPTTWHLQVRKNGTPDHGLMGAAWAALHEGYRGNKYAGPNAGEALSKLKKLYESEKMDTPATKEAQEPEPQLSWLDRVIATIKGDSPGHPFRGNQFEGGSGGSAGGESESSGNGEFSHIKTPRKGETIKLATDPATKGELHLHDDRNVWLHSSSGKSNKGPLDNLKKNQFAARFQWNDVTNKEGRRNSSPDGDRLQQIHDLAVLNGASCPMVMKEASGKLRWVLLSSNAFQDSDKEIISQKALEDDVARTDKQAQAQKIGSVTFGPLRWWHMGAPDPIGLHAGSGADIGDCDYRAMSGRVLIESGTFRNEQIGAAVKERADTLAGSIGFFHPKDEPDNEGVYRNIVQFERSLLPRGKASNTLTALTVKGDSDMATSKEKTDALAALLGDQSLAESVIKQAEATEKAADDRGLKYKEEKIESKKALTGTPTAVPATGASGINPLGLEKDKAKQAEGTPGEENTEPKKEAESEPDWEALMKGLGPHISKMIKEEMKAVSKETAEKEAGLKAAVDQIVNDLKELKGDAPRIMAGGFRASVSDMTIIPNINQKAAEVTTIDSVIDQLMGIKK